MADTRLRECAKTHCTKLRALRQEHRDCCKSKGVQVSLCCAFITRRATQQSPLDGMARRRVGARLLLLAQFTQALRVTRRSLAGAAGAIATAPQVANAVRPPEFVTSQPGFDTHKVRSPDQGRQRGHRRGGGHGRPRRLRVGGLHDRLFWAALREESWFERWRL